jgi:hypothetical protein
MNGGACHWFDQAQQVIFENNTCTGNNPMTMGNNIDTYGEHTHLYACIVHRLLFITFSLSHRWWFCPAHLPTRQQDRLGLGK